MGVKSIFIKTFGCVQNVADSERIKAYYWNGGWTEAEDWRCCQLIVINTCVVRESAENRVYGFINEINKYKKTSGKEIKVVLTGCLVNTKSRQKIAGVDQVIQAEKISLKLKPIRGAGAALVPISNGCNNHCSYCIVPKARGQEKSRKMEEIMEEVCEAIRNGFKEIVLIGQNVNSYGADLDNSESLVSMGKKRVKSMFPKLLEKVAKLPIEKISFVSSNPWDFSDELIEVISRYKNINRLIHLPLQSGDDDILKRMNRGYTAKEYVELTRRITKKIDGAKFSTDIIVGFPGEDEEAFLNTAKVCEQVGFEVAYLNKYSPRRGTVSAKLYRDDVPQAEKRRRWRILDNLINKKVTGKSEHR